MLPRKKVREGNQNAAKAKGTQRVAISARVAPATKIWLDALAAQKGGLGKALDSLAQLNLTAKGR